MCREVSVGRPPRRARRPSVLRSCRPGHRRTPVHRPVVAPALFAWDRFLVRQSEGLLNLLLGTSAWTALWLFAYVSVRRRGVHPSPPARLPPATESTGDGVRRVVRTTHEYNYSAARRDYLVRRYALRWLILPGALISLALGLGHLSEM